MGTHKHTRHSSVNSSIIKMQYFYNRLICKKTAFLQKYIFVKKELFYVKKQYFYNRFTCKKGLFYIKKAAFLQKYIFVKKQYFYNRLTCKKAVIFTTVQFVKKQLFYTKMTLFYKDRFFYATWAQMYDQRDKRG